MLKNLRKPIAFLTAFAMLAAAAPVLPAELFGGVTVYAEAYEDDTDYLGDYIDHYVMEELGYPSASLFDFNDSGRASLTDEQKLVYDAAITEIKKIAVGERGSTNIGVSYTRESGWGTFDVSSILKSVLNALLKDYPYELYWYDKTVGCSVEASISDSGCTLNLKFTPASAYKSSADYTVDTAKTTAAKTAVNNITDIIGKYNGKSDFEKLKGYKDEICELVSYNDEAASNSSTPYGDPWQLIYVFDNNTSTNVVCEGYSKAFKYLCDLTEFSAPIYCYLVTGTMNGGGHMWNIVDFGDKTYHVDVTNCDGDETEHAIGYPDKLFLKGVTSPSGDGFTAVGMSYVFDGEDKTFYANEISRLSTTDYTEPSVITGIAVSESSTHKKEYTVGDSFDPTGLVITAAYNDSSTTQITYSDSNKNSFSFSPETFTEATDEANVTITYGGKTATTTVKVSTIDISGGVITLSGDSFKYSGEKIKPTVTFTLNSATLTEGTDYTVSYSDNTNAGEATVTVTGKGKYSGTATKNFTIGKATPTAATPTASAIDYGKKLSESVLSDTGWSWAEPDTIPTVGNSGYNATIDVSAYAANYDYSTIDGYDSATGRITRTVSVTVNAVTPDIVVITDSTAARPGETVNVSVVVTNPYNSDLSDLPEVSLSYGLGEDEAVPISGNSFVIPEGAAVGTTIKVFAITSETTGYNAGSGSTEVKVTDCEHKSKALKHDEDYHWYHCDNCNGDFDKAEHIGKEATEDTAEICSTCGYIINPASGRVAAPVINPNGGSFSGSQEITITCITKDAVIYYTTNGDEPTSDSTKYTGAFTITTNATVKAIALKSGVGDSEIAEAIFIKKSAGGSSSGGSSGGSSSGTFHRPSTPTPAPEPQIGGSNGKTGWDVIVDEIKDEKDGGSLNINMNGVTELPKNILEAIEGKDIDIVLDMGDGITWTINGEDIENPEAIDLSVSNTSKIPAKVINKVTGEKDYVTLSLKHNGDFGFKATLTIDLGKKNKNLYANLYYYNEKTKKTEFVGSCKIDKNGDADFLFTHASDYIIIIDKADHAKPQPKGTSTKDSITLRWAAVQGAEKYKVYKYINGKAVKVKETEKLGFKFTKLKPGKKYSYIVRAYVDGKWTTMKKSDIVTVTTKKK